MSCRSHHFHICFIMLHPSMALLDSMVRTTNTRLAPMDILLAQSSNVCFVESTCLIKPSWICDSLLPSQSSHLPCREKHDANLRSEDVSQWQVGREPRWVNGGKFQDVPSISVGETSMPLFDILLLPSTHRFPMGGCAHTHCEFHELVSSTLAGVLQLDILLVFNCRWHIPLDSNTSGVHGI